MRMRIRVKLFLVTYVFGGVLGLAIFDANGFFTIGWFLFFGISQWYILKCPSCGEFACKDKFLGITFYVPYAKDKCLKCGAEF